MPPAGGGGYDNYADGSGGYSQYSQGGGYDYNTQHEGYGGDSQYSTSYGAPTGGPGGGNEMITYPPLRSQSQGGGRGGGEDATIKGKHGIKMRGLPYSAEEKEILDFFLPHVPVKVLMEYNQYGRPAGTAEVMFSTHEEAEKAMDKHNAHMGKYSTTCLYSVCM